MIFQYVGVVGYVSVIAPGHLRAAALGFCASAIFVVGMWVVSIYCLSFNIEVVPKVKLFPNP